MIKNFKSLYGFGDAVSTSETSVWILKVPCFKVYNLVSVHPISMKLGQMTNLNMIFHVDGLVKI